MSINSWKEDLFLSTISDSDVQFYSFDIFETIVFRKVYSSEDIHRIVYQSAVEANIIDSTIGANAYQKIRSELQKLASKRLKKEEASIDEIYSLFPENIGDVNALKNLEFLTDKKNCYLNPVMYSLLQHLYNQKKKVVLVSNMYYSRQQIVDLLTSVGFDHELYDELFVSSEYGVKKNSGNLFKEVLAYYPTISPLSILHIGDNFEADYLGANKANIPAIHYNIHKIDFNNPVDFEMIFYGNILEPLYLLRKSMSYHQLSQNNFQMNLGCLVFGPLFHAFIEWLAVHIQEKNIERVLVDSYNPFLFMLLRDCLKDIHLQSVSLDSWQNIKQYDNPNIAIVSLNYHEEWNKVLNAQHFIFTPPPNFVKERLRGILMYSFVQTADDFDTYESEQLSKLLQYVCDKECQDIQEGIVCYIDNIPKHFYTFPIHFEIVKYIAKRLIQFPLQNEVITLNSVFKDGKDVDGRINSQFQRVALNKYNQSIFNLTKQLSNLMNYQKVVIYGAGVIGQRIFETCKLLCLQVSFFVDRNFESIPQNMYDVPVQSIASLDDTVDLIIIASKAFYNEIRQDIIKHYDERTIPTIIGI